MLEHRRKLLRKKKEEQEQFRRKKRIIKGRGQRVREASLLNGSGRYTGELSGVCVCVSRLDNTLIGSLVMLE